MAATVSDQAAEGPDRGSSRLGRGLLQSAQCLCLLQRVPVTELTELYLPTTERIEEHSTMAVEGLMASSLREI